MLSSNTCIRKILEVLIKIIEYASAAGIKYVERL
jgi:hypothetical protein